MPYPIHSRITAENRTNDYPASLDLEVAALGTYNQLRTDFNISHAAYLQTTHASQIEDIFSEDADNWKIDRIVIAGIGYPPKPAQLSMILHIADVLDRETGKKINSIYSQEDPSLAKLELDLDADYLKGCEVFLQSLGITHLVASETPGEYTKPVDSKFTSKTLLYTPFLISDVVLSFMQDTDPELFINIDVERYDSTLEWEPEDIERVVMDFQENRFWKHGPIFGTKGCCDEGQLSELCIYWRAGGEIDETWTSDSLDEPTMPEGWNKRCDKHRNG